MNTPCRSPLWLLAALCVFVPGQVLAQKKQRSEPPALMASAEAARTPEPTVADALSVACTPRREPDWEAVSAASGVNRFDVAGDLSAANVSMGSNHYASALPHVRAAADAGHPAGRYLLGLMFMDGRGVARDPQQSAYWLGRAAAQGHAAAQFAFGRACMAGFGVSPSPVDARHWMEKAAAQGHEAARQWLQANP